VAIVTCGVTRELRQAKEGSCQHVVIDDGETWQLDDFVRPAASETVYLAIVVPPQGAANDVVVTFTSADITLVGVYHDGAAEAYSGTTTLTVTTPNKALAFVFSLTRGASSTSFTTDVTVLVGAADTITFTVAGDWSFTDADDEEFQPYWTNSFRKTFVCAKCDHHFKEGNGGLLGGVPYCNRYGCYEEEMYERRKRNRR
jgi:hypothetical protein